MKAFLLLGLSILAAVALIGSVVVFESYHADRIYPGVYVWGVDVSGMTLEQATEALQASMSRDDVIVTLRGPEQTWQARPSDLGAALNFSAMLAPAYEMGRGAGWSENVLGQLRLMLSPVNLPPVVVYDIEKTRAYLTALARELDRTPSDATMTLEGSTPVVMPASPGRRMDVEATLGSVAPLVGQLAGGQVDLVVTPLMPAVVDAEVARTEAQVFLSEPLTLVLDQPREGDPGPWVIPTEQLVTMLVIRDENGVLRASLNEGALRAYLEGVAPALAIEPVAARYHFNEWNRQLEPILASVVGRALNVEASAARIIEYLTAGRHYVPLVVEAVASPYPDTATAEELGIIERVAVGDSYFIGSPSARDHNIRVAAKKFDGVVIPPGETFSFNEILGPVTVEEGYDESYITAGDLLAIEVGGGICQVSTTAFRAAFWGGYPITERWAHENRIGYYELQGAGIGMDATVYSPWVDFKFVNDRDFPLLIETEIDDAAHRLTFRFYSTSDGRRVEADDPVITDREEPGPPIYQLDESMAPGTVKQWQSPVSGLTATIVRRVYDASGELMAQNTFVSRFKPRREAFHHGPGYEVPETPEELTPTPEAEPTTEG